MDKLKQAYITHTTDNYEQITINLVNSISSFSDKPIVVYTIDYTATEALKSIATCIRLDLELPKLSGDDFLGDGIKYVNRSTISIDINNARNPQVKKILRTIDNYIGSIYFKLSKKKQQEFYFKDIDEYQNLPDEIIIQESTFSDLTISNNKNFNNNKLLSFNQIYANPFAFIDTGNTVNLSLSGCVINEYNFYVGII